VPVVSGFSERSAGLRNNLAAAAIIAGGLVWHILHPPSEDAVSALSPVAGKLQPHLQNNPAS